MDNIGGFLGNATDGIGQGLAYVLPNSRTESYAIQLNQERAAQQRAQAALLLKQQQDANDDYAKHLYETKIPEHNQLWDKAIQDKYDTFINDAAKYHSATGKDPFIQPDFLNRRADITSMADRSKQAAASAVALSTALQNDKDGKLNPADKQAAAQWLVNYNSDPIKYGAVQVPTLSSKPYDITDAQKLMKPVGLETNDGHVRKVVANRLQHLTQAQDILNDPKFDNLKNKVGINPAIGDVFSIHDVNGPQYPTDEPTVRRFAQHILTDPELPGSKATLAAAGISPNDPNAEQKLTEIGMKQNAGYGGLINGLGDYADARVGPKTEVVYTADNNAMAHARLGLARQANARAAANAGGATAGQPIDFALPYKTPAGKAANVNAHGYVPVSIPNKNFAGSPAYNLSTGKVEPQLESSDGYSIVGVGNFPFIKKGYQLEGSIAQPNFQVKHPDAIESKPMVHIHQPAKGDEEAKDYLIPYDKLPENIKNSKSVKQALSNFVPANTATQATPAGTPLDNKHKKAATDYGL